METLAGVLTCVTTLRKKLINLLTVRSAYGVGGTILLVPLRIALIFFEKFFAKVFLVLVTLPVDDARLASFSIRALLVVTCQGILNAMSHWRIS